MTTDRFLVVRQLAVECARCVRRVACGFSIWGDPPVDQGVVRGSRNLSGAGAERKDEKEPTRKLPVEYTRELTPIEQAVAKVLPLWPEAMEAVHRCAADLMGIVIPPGAFQFGDRGRPGERDPVPAGG